MKTKLSRSEKFLALTPLFVGVCLALSWWIRQRSYPVIQVPPSQFYAISISPDSTRAVIGYSTKGNEHYSLYRLSPPRKIYEFQSLQPHVVTLPLRWAANGKQVFAPYSFNPPTLWRGVALWNTSDGHLVANVQYKLKNLLYEPNARCVNQPLPEAEVPVSSPILQDVTTGQPTHTLDRLLIWSSLDLNDKAPHKNWVLRSLKPGKDTFDVRDRKTGAVVWRPQWPSNFGVTTRMDWSDDDVLGVHYAVQNITLEGRLLLWDAHTRRTISTPPESQNFDFAFCPHAPLIAIAGVAPGRDIFNGSQLLVWNYRTRSPVWRNSMSAVTGHPTWSPDGRWLLVRETINSKYHVWLFDQRGYTFLHRSSEEYFECRFSPNSQKVLLGYDGRVEIVPLNQGT